MSVAARIRIHLHQPDAPVKSGLATAAATELFELRAAAEHSRHVVAKSKPDRKPVAIVKQGSIELPIYKCKDRNFAGIWYDGRKRKTIRRADLADLKEALKQKAIAMANGETYMASMTQAQRATLEAVEKILQPTGISPELAASEYAAQICKLKSVNLQTSLGLIVDDFIERESRAKIVDISCTNLVDQYLTARRLNTWGIRRAHKNCLRTYTTHLSSFKEYFKCNLGQLDAASIDAWLDWVGAGGVTRKGYRTSLSPMISYAKDKKHLRQDWDELKSVKVQKAAKPKKATITPDQMIKLLYFAYTSERYLNMVPFIACSGFAGIRHQELNPPFDDKSPLNWSDIDFSAREIHVREETDKNGKERWVQMPDNLVKWLLPHSKRSGPICDVPNTVNSLSALKTKAKIKTGKRETRNCLRKSWESYSQAIRKDIERVAGEAGHTQEMARQHYLVRKLEPDGRRWFNITPPETEGVLPLNFRATA